MCEHTALHEGMGVNLRFLPPRTMSWSPIVRIRSGPSSARTTPITSNAGISQVPAAERVLRLTDREREQEKGRPDDVPVSEEEFTKLDHHHGRGAGRRPVCRLFADSSSLHPATLSFREARRHDIALSPLAALK